MIEPEDYKLPGKQHEKPKPKAESETLAYLGSLPWRPFTEEW